MIHENQLNGFLGAMEKYLKNRIVKLRSLISKTKFSEIDQEAFHYIELLILKNWF